MDIKLLANIINCFHDGSITKIIKMCNNYDFEMFIEIQYLAERLDNSISGFFLHLINVSHFEYITWDSNEIINDYNYISTIEPEILSCDINDGVLKISTLLDIKNECGGNLNLMCDDIVIKDENNIVISVDNLINLSDEYWEEFSRR